MDRKPIYLKNDIALAMQSYNNTHEHYFSTTELIVMNIIASGEYINDADLAHLAMTSERTIKRSINKLCEFGILEKHIAQNHTKTLIVNQAALNTFINQQEATHNEKRF